MAGYKSPDFNERMATARAAKQSALDRLKDKPAPDPALIAERHAARAARDARAALKREAGAAKAAESAAKAQSEADAAQAGAPENLPPSEAEQKAARDARYAARKARKK